MAKRKTKATPTTKEVAEKAVAPVQDKHLSQIDRIAQMGTDYGAKWNQQVAKGVYAKYGSMGIPELQAALKTPELTVLERSVIIHLSKINTTGKDSLQAIQYFHERAFGKVENKTELTGNNGGPIEIKTDEIGNLIDGMSDEEVEALEQSLDQLENILGKANVTKSES